MSFPRGALTRLGLRHSYPVAFVILAALAANAGCNRRGWGGEDIASQTANLVTDNNTITRRT